jgi:hypothetical protein
MRNTQEVRDGVHFPGYFRVQIRGTSLCNLLALVHPEDGGDTILRNVGFYKSHMASSPRR